MVALGPRWVYGRCAVLGLPDGLGESPYSPTTYGEFVRRSRLRGEPRVGSTRSRSSPRRDFARPGDAKRSPGKAGLALRTVARVPVDEPSARPPTGARAAVGSRRSPSPWSIAPSRMALESSGARRGRVVAATLRHSRIPGFPRIFWGLAETRPESDSEPSRERPSRGGSSTAEDRSMRGLARR